MNLLTNPRARQSDPITSHKAAARINATAQVHHELIVAALTRYGALGVDGISMRCGVLAHAIGKRMKELQRSQHIELTGNLVEGRSGRLQREWRILVTD